MHVQQSQDMIKNKLDSVGNTLRNEQQSAGSIQETELRVAAVSKQRRIIHFSSGETMEEEDSDEEEEETSDGHPFSEPEERTRLSLKTVAILVGRISLLTCDFLGGRLATALGLNAAKYQYAIDQYHHDHKVKSSQVVHNQRGHPETETSHPPSRLERNRYGATDGRYPVDSQKSCDETHKDRHEGFLNRGYQAEDSFT